MSRTVAAPMHAPSPTSPSFKQSPSPPLVVRFGQTSLVHTFSLYSPFLFFNFSTPIRSSKIDDGDAGLGSAGQAPRAQARGP